MFHVKRCRKAAVFSLSLSEYVAIMEATALPIQSRPRGTPLLSLGAAKHYPQITLYKLPASATDFLAEQAMFSGTRE